MQVVLDLETKRRYACPQGRLYVPGVDQGSIQAEEEINWIRSIDWSPYHCVFMDERNRIFTFGDNMYGLTGLQSRDKEADKPS
jgi:hypothetical protein